VYLRGHELPRAITPRLRGGTSSFRNEKLFYCDTWRVPEGYPPGIKIKIFNFCFGTQRVHTHLVLVGYHSIFLKIITAMVFTPDKALGCWNSQNNQPSPYGAAYFGNAPALGIYPTLPNFSEDLMTHTWP
jgi:hypothetical protein